MEEILCISFNQNYSQILIGTTQGFKVVQIYPPKLLFEEKSGGFRIVESYEDSNLLILVGSGHHPSHSPRRLLVWSLLDKTAICETHLPDTILSVCVNRQRIIAVLADSLYLFDTMTMKKQKVIEPCVNPLGICCVSDNFLLYPAGGNIVIYDWMKDERPNEISAHRSNLAALGVHESMCASASIKGTVILVWQIPHGEKLFTFKRGIMNVQTFSLSFFRHFLVTCSNSGSVHLFSLNREEGQAFGWSDKIRRGFMNAVSFIAPSGYALDSARSFAIARTALQYKFSTAIVPQSNYLIAFSFSGLYMYFVLDLENGGEAVKIEEGNLRNILRD